MTDKFSKFATGLESPAAHVASVIPDDTTDLPVASRALNVSSAGAVRVTTVGDTTETVFVAAGLAFPLRAKRIWQTGTTASGIVVMY